jgi:hypothetical protein
MTIMGNNSMTMAEFAELLDVYGSKRARWSAEARAAAAQLVAADPAARRLLAETEALDRILNRAPLPGLPVEAALADRIVAAAQRSPRIVRLPGAQRVAEDASAEEEAASGSPRAAAGANAAVVFAPAVAAGRGGRWGLLSRPTGAAGVLAASLVMGILIGNLNSLSPQLLPALAEMVGFTDRDDLVRIALSDEVTL